MSPEEIIQQRLAAQAAAPAINPNPDVLRTGMPPQVSGRVAGTLGVTQPTPIQSRVAALAAEPLTNPNPQVLRTAPMPDLSRIPAAAGISRELPKPGVTGTLAKAVGPVARAAGVMQAGIGGAGVVDSISRGELPSVGDVKDTVLGGLTAYNPVVGGVANLAASGISALVGTANAAEQKPVGMDRVQAGPITPAPAASEAGTPGNPKAPGVAGPVPSILPSVVQAPRPVRRPAAAGVTPKPVAQPMQAAPAENAGALPDGAVQVFQGAKEFIERPSASGIGMDMVPKSIYEAGRADEYQQAEAQGAIDALNQFDAKTRGQLEVQALQNQGSAGVASIHADASRYGTDVQAQTNRDTHRYVVVPGGEETDPSNPLLKVKRPSQVFDTQAGKVTVGQTDIGKGTASASPKVGEVRGGFRFVGGNPADPKSWEKQ